MIKYKIKEQTKINTKTLPSLTNAHFNPESEIISSISWYWFGVIVFFFLFSLIWTLSNSSYSSYLLSLFLFLLDIVISEKKLLSFYYIFVPLFYYLVPVFGDVIRLGWMWILIRLELNVGDFFIILLLFSTLLLFILILFATSLLGWSS